MPALKTCKRNDRSTLTIAKTWINQAKSSVEKAKMLGDNVNDDHGRLGFSGRVGASEVRRPEGLHELLSLVTASLSESHSGSFRGLFLTHRKVLNNFHCVGVSWQYLTCVVVARLKQPHLGTATLRDRCSSST